MSAKTKTSDCIEMKQRIQRALWRQYQQRKGEFASYADFIVATTAANRQVAAWRRKMQTQRVTPVERDHGG